MSFEFVKEKMGWIKLTPYEARNIKKWFLIVTKKIFGSVETIVKITFPHTISGLFKISRINILS